MYSASRLPAVHLCLIEQHDAASFARLRGAGSGGDVPLGSAGPRNGSNAVDRDAVR